MSDDLSPEEIHAAVRRAVEGLLAAAGVTEPPVDAVALARSHLKLPDLEGKRKPADEEGCQLLAAQRIGSHLKPDILRHLGIGEGPRPLLGESLAKLVAARLLLPDAWFADEARSAGFDVACLKGIFPTASLELIAWRLLDLAEPSLVTVVDNGHVTKRRANTFRAPRQLLEAEKTCLERVHGESRPHRVRLDGWTAWGWPAHRADWRREVLRAVPDDAEV